MTSHLSPGEFVDMLDGALPAARAQHLDRCEACRREQATLAAVLNGARGDDAVPDPSPFFWEQTSAAIRRRVTGIDGPRAHADWRSWMRPRPVAVGLSALAAVAALVIVFRAPLTQKLRAPEPLAKVAPTTTAVPGDEAAQWALVEQTTAALSPDDVYQVTASGPELSNANQLDNLTPAERAAFVRLLESELGHTP